MKKKIIYINYTVLSEKLLNDFYISNLINNGFVVEYWDISLLVFKKIQATPLLGAYIFEIHNYSKLEEKIANEKSENTIYIIMNTYERRVVKLFKLLEKYSCHLAFFARGALPNNSSDLKFPLSKILKVFNPKLLYYYLQNNYAAYLKISGRIKHFDLVFNAGNMGCQTIGQGSQVDIDNSEIINVNSFDFDSYRITSNCENLIKGRYCLFLDEYLPFHPDFELLGIKTVESEKYYNSLNKFFDKIENKFCIKVVIAAHPKADKYKTSNFFYEREVYFDRTAMLTKYSEFTIAHCSTSVSFSVLNNKPIWFLYSNPIQLIMPNYFRFILNFSEVLSGLIVNIDNYELSNLYIPQINSNKYSNYKYNYLTSESSENRNSSDIFLEVITNL